MIVLRLLICPTVLLAISLQVTSPVCAWADTAGMKGSATKLTSQKTCPVMGGTIDKNVYVDVKGYRVYLCCPGCADAIRQNPDRYLKVLADQGQAVEKVPVSEKAPVATPATAEGPGSTAIPAAPASVAPGRQKTCPVTGEVLTNRNAYLDYRGQRIYVCCAGCLSAVKKDPQKACKTLADRGETVENINE